MRGGPLRCALALAAALALGPGLAAAHGGHGGAAAPEGFGLLVLPGGRAVKLLQVGPALGPDGQLAGLGASYLSDASSLEEVEAEALPLFAYLRPRAEAQGQAAVVLYATVGFAPGRLGPSVKLTWRRDAAGAWRTLPRDPAATFPATALPRPSTPARDPAAEEAARAAAEAWLALIDRGEHARAWEGAAPLLQAQGSRNRLAAVIELLDDEVGKVAGRAPVAALSTRLVPGLPDGSYRVVEYQGTRVGRPGPVFEAVVTTRGDDGRWRAAAYTRH
jgi:hypothetical protein